MNACALPNGPSWSDEAIAQNWEGLTRALPRDWLPIRGADTQLTRRPVFDEYGCGSYGCVYPTQNEGVVFKLTSDATEADFVGIVQALRAHISGIVRYHRILKLEGVRTRTHLHRTAKMPLYAIVRESADKVGEMNEVTGGDRPSAQRVLGMLTSFKEIASAVRRGTKELGEGFARSVYESDFGDDAANHLAPAMPTDMRPSHRIRPGQVDLHLPDNWDQERMGALAFSSLVAIAEAMEKEPVGYWIGSALRQLLEEGIVLADVHHKNIGVVHRNRERAWVITDPGHCVRLRSDLPRAQIDGL